MDFLDLGIKLISGGITGYLTNNLAIKMLFKKYGPFGGVILKTREEFIQNTSELVERDIINHHTIEKELTKDEFRLVFQKIVADILNLYLEQNTGEIKLGEIPGIQDSFENVLNFFTAQQSTYIESLLELFLPNILLTEVLSVEQVRVLTERFFDLLLIILQESDLLEGFLLDSVTELGELQLTEFIPHIVLQQVETNLLRVSSDLHSQLQDFETQIESSLAMIYDRLEIRRIISSLETSLKSRTIEDILLKANETEFKLQESTQKMNSKIGQKTVKELIDHLLKYLKTEDGQELLADFIAEILQMLKQVEIPVIELLGEKIGKNLEFFIEEKLPQILTGVIGWIEVNQKEIEALLEEAIEETLGEESGGLLGGKFKKYLYDVFLKGNAVNTLELVSKLIEGLESKTDLSTLSRELSAEALNFLKNEQLGELINKFEERGIIKIPEFVQMIVNNLDILNNIELPWVDELLTTRIGEWITFDLSESFADYFKNTFIQTITQKFILSKGFIESIQKEITKTFSMLAETQFAQLLQDYNLINDSVQIKNLLVTEMSKRRVSFVDNISKMVSQSFEGCRLTDYMDQELVNQLSKGLDDSSRGFLGIWIEEIKQSRMGNLYEMIKEQKNISDEIADLILRLVQENLHLLLQGKIHEVVYNNLSELDDQDVLAMVEDFMGRELKPITYFGGGLGFLAAIVLYGLQGFVGDNLLLQTPISVFTYGFVGYITNVIALKMIFRPYTEKRIFGMKIPFTPGVVAKEKPRFAQAMGKFVGDSLLNHETVEEIFKKNRQMIHENLTTMIADGNYRRIEEFLLNESNQEFISDKIYDSLLSLLTPEVREKLMHRLVTQFFELPLAHLELVEFTSRIIEEAEKIVALIPEYLRTVLEEMYNNETSLKNVCPDFAIQKGFQILENIIAKKVSSLQEMLSDELKVNQLLNGLEPGFRQMKEQRVIDLMAKSQFTQIQNELSGYMVQRLTDDETKEKIVSYLEAKFLNQLDSEKTLGELFDGILIKTVQDHTDRLITGLLDRLLRYFQNEEEQIVKIVLEAAQKEGGFLFTIGKLFKIDATIAGVVHKLIMEKIPRFLDQKKDELSIIVTEFINNVQDSRVSTLGLDIRRTGVTDVVDDLLSKQVVETSLKPLIAGIMEGLFQYRLESYLKMCSLDNMKRFLQAFSGEINQFRTELSEMIITEHTLITQECRNMIQRILTSSVMELPLTTFLKGIEFEDLCQIITAGVEQVQQTQAYDHSLYKGVEAFLLKLKMKRFSEILQLDYLQRDLEYLLDKILKDLQIQVELGDVLGRIIGDLFQNTNRLLTLETKNYLLQLVTMSTLDSVEGNFLQLINSVNIKNVTVREVDHMGAEKIEELFESFAGIYFRKLESYGWVGSIFGLIELFQLLKK